MKRTGKRRLVVLVFLFLCAALHVCCAADVKQPDAAGKFYPVDTAALSVMIDGFMAQANPVPVSGGISVLIVPHAGYEFSGQIAADTYKLVRGKPVTSVVLMASAHQSAFEGIVVAGQEAFHTPLGDIPVDRGFISQLIAAGSGIVRSSAAFRNEHPIEVQLPFLQKIVPGAQVVPVLFGRVDYPALERFSVAVARAIGSRQDVLLIASSDMYHGYDVRQAEAVDSLTLDYLRAMDAQALYQALEDKKAQLCSGPAVVAAMLAAQKSGPAKLTVLAHTNSSKVKGHVREDVFTMKQKEWTVGYSSSVIVKENAASGEQKGGAMLTQVQKKQLLGIARSSIETYLKAGKKLNIEESDPALSQKMGSFVTLHENGALRGCIGNIVGTQPLYLTVRDMAVEAAVGDPRFAPLKLGELKGVTIEISALSVLKKVASADDIELGKHGVIVKRGFNSGVFLPQVATETGWSKEEFLSTLCSQKAGLPADAWKDPDTELYIFTAEVFSE